MQHNAKLFSLVLLMSTIIIYNTVGEISFEHAHFFNLLTTMSQNQL